MEANRLYEQGMDSEAISELRKLFVDEPTNAEAFLLCGRIYHHQGDEEAAIACLKTSIFWDSSQTVIDAHILLGESSLRDVTGTGAQVRR
jgi:predicted Zn-dependent protease